MIGKRYTWTIILFFLAATVSALENYVDYGTDEAPSNERPSIRDLYRWLVQRSVEDADGFRGLGSEQLQPRAAERSPSLRLRFGRSYTSKYPRSPSLRLRFGRSYPSPYDLSSRVNGGSATAAAVAQQQEN